MTSEISPNKRFVGHEPRQQGFFAAKWPAYRKQVEGTPMKLFKE